jgi:hypothetical protein
MHHNLERIKKYNYLVIEKLLHPIPANETVSVQLSDYETCSSSESEFSYCAKVLHTAQTHHGTRRAPAVYRALLRRAAAGFVHDGEAANWIL